MAESGPNICGTVSQAASTPYDDTVWSVPERLTADDGSYAYITTSSFDTGLYSYLVKCTNFGFEIPAGATIDGVTVELDSCYETSTWAVAHIKLLDADGVAQGDDRYSDDGDCTSTSTLAPDILTFGGATETWGATLSSAVVNDADWGIQFAIQAKGDDCDALIDSCGVTVAYTEATPPEFTGIRVTRHIGA